MDLKVNKECNLIIFYLIIMIILIIITIMVINIKTMEDCKIAVLVDNNFNIMKIN